jgi:pyridinium-3,5-bisthiocarboxylic acid mononucleotide nickel chelatase
MHRQTTKVEKLYQSPHLIGNMSSYEAHWDCLRGGVSGEALLASCIDAAAGSDGAKANALVQNFQSCIENGLLVQPTTKFDFAIVLKRISSKIGDDEESAWTLRVVVEDDDKTTNYSLSELQDMLLPDSTPDDYDLEKAIPKWVRETAVQVLTEVAKAQDKAYGGVAVSEETTTQSSSKIFKVACLVEVVGTLLGLVQLGGVKVVSCSPIPVLDGTIGASPVVLQLLMGMPTTTVLEPSLSSEVVQNTAIGVALLRVLSGVSQSSRIHSRATSMILRSSGLGTSHTKYPTKGVQDSPLRAVRILVGEVPSVSQNPAAVATCSTPTTSQNVPESFGSDLWLSDSVTLLECNLDDMTGEALAYVMELLLRKGAADAWVTPILMKKGRPAYTLSCLCPSVSSGMELGDPDAPDDYDATTKIMTKALLELIFRHTTTLGVRIHADMPRAKLRRTLVSVPTPFGGLSHRHSSGSGARGGSIGHGLVAVKVGQFCNSDEIISKKAEYDDCRAISMATGVPITTVAEYAIRHISSFDNRLLHSSMGSGMSLAGTASAPSSPRGAGFEEESC